MTNRFLWLVSSLVYGLYVGICTLVYAWFVCVCMYVYAYMYVEARGQSQEPCLFFEPGFYIGLAGQ